LDNLLVARICAKACQSLKQMPQFTVILVRNFTFTDALKTLLVSHVYHEMTGLNKQAQTQSPAAKHLCSRRADSRHWPE